MTTKLKWGILGYARIARNEVIPAILRAENSELYALASGNPDKLKECEKLYPNTKLYNDYDKLIEDPKVQAIYIPLPNSMHKEWTIRAIRQGKHVLCEKPIALNSAECWEMMQAAKDHHVHVMEAFMYRYTDRIKQVNEILASGEIGTIKHINSTFRFLLDRPNSIKMNKELGGGSLYDVGTYPLNFVGMLTDAIPESYAVECIMDNEVDQIFSAVLKYADGVIAVIHSGFNAFNQMNTEVVGTEGRLEIPDTFLGTEGTIQVVTKKGTRKITVAESDRYKLEVYDFADAILHNRKPMLSLDESYRNMQVLDQLLKARK